MFFRRRKPADAERSGPGRPAGRFDAARDSLARIEKKLDEIEAEMKRIGYWHDDPPDLLAKYGSGKYRSFLDAPSFELWLQQVFLPNARQAVKEAELPRESQVGLMAMRQYDYHSFMPEAVTLVRLLHEFDSLVVRHGELSGASG